VKPGYLLDTNICIYIIRRHPKNVTERMDRCRMGEVAMSSITHAELEYGVLCADDQAQARQQLDLLLKAVPPLPFDHVAAAAYGPLRFAGRDRRKDLMDKLIAAHALAMEMVLVTNNVADFRQYAGLEIENWSAAQ
jgi:tRNA(fMet)-specific endonuclease VapC